MVRRNLKPLHEIVSDDLHVEIIERRRDGMAMRDIQTAYSLDYHTIKRIVVNAGLSTNKLPKAKSSGRQGVGQKATHRCPSCKHKITTKTCIACKLLGKILDEDSL